MPELGTKRQNSPKTGVKERTNRNKLQTSYQAVKEEESLCDEVGKDDREENIAAPASEAEKDANDSTQEPLFSEKGNTAFPAPPAKPRDTMRHEPILVPLVVVRYEGESDEEGFFHGRGFAEFHGGHTYEGEFVAGKMHNYGTYTWKDGISYMGNFDKNVITGQGLLLSGNDYKIPHISVHQHTTLGYQVFALLDCCWVTNSDVTSETLVASEKSKDSSGKYVWSNGSAYEGEVLNGLRHGKGRYLCRSTGSVYEGQWVAGKRHGQGTLYYNGSSTSYYSGEWRDNHKCGVGTMFYRSGNKYEGHWLNDLRNGKGRMQWLDRGEEYRGEWINGKMTGFGTYTWYIHRAVHSQYPLRNEYHGQFVNGVRQGKGTFHYASGASYSGVWRQNKKHGYGKFTFKNGLTFEGLFENDRIVGHADMNLCGLATPEIENSGLPLRSQTPLRGETPTGTTDVFEINLVPLFQEHKIDIDLQVKETDEISRTLLQHVSFLRSAYRFYSSLGHNSSVDNTFILTQFQLWRILKDIGVPRLGFSLADVDRAIALSQESQASPHYPYHKVFFRDFINALINVSFLVCGETQSENPSLFSSAFSRFLTDHFLPKATCVKGTIFSEPLIACVVKSYLEPCHKIYLYFVEAKRTASLGKHDCLTVRDFLFFMKDLKLINEYLTASKIISIMLAELVDNQSEALEFNLNYEIVFLDFMEALVGCSQCLITDDMCEYYLKLLAEGAIQPNEPVPNNIGDKVPRKATADSKKSDTKTGSAKSSDYLSTEPSSTQAQEPRTEDAAKELPEKSPRAEKVDQNEAGERVNRSSFSKERSKEASKSSEGKLKGKREEKGTLMDKHDKRERGDGKLSKKSHDSMKRDRSKESSVVSSPDTKPKASSGKELPAANRDSEMPPIIVTSSSNEQITQEEGKEDAEALKSMEDTNAMAKKEGIESTSSPALMLQDSGLPFVKTQSMSSLELFSMKLKIFMESYVAPAFKQRQLIDALLEAKAVEK